MVTVHGLERQIGEGIPGRLHGKLWEPCKGEEAVISIIKNNTPTDVDRQISSRFLVSFGIFIRNHYPEYKEIAGKYLALIQ